MNKITKNLKLLNYSLVGSVIMIVIGLGLHMIETWINQYTWIEMREIVTLGESVIFYSFVGLLIFGVSRIIFPIIKKP